MLLSRFTRVLYIDLDAHHGDGVENAFLTSARVLTLSVHHAYLWPGREPVSCCLLTSLPC